MSWEPPFVSLTSVTVTVVGEARLMSIIWRYLVSLGWEIKNVNFFLNIQPLMCPVKPKKDNITITSVSLQLSDEKVILQLFQIDFNRFTIKSGQF